jgi:hypothetical protein
MKKTSKIDIQSLQEEAKKSEVNEAFTIVTKMQNCRIGVGARLESPETSAYFVEVLISLCTSHHPVNLDLAEKNLFLLRQLDKRGYMLNCEEDGCISCELIVSSEKLIAECEAATLIIENAHKR